MLKRGVILLILVLISVNSIYPINKEQELDVGQSVKVGCKTFTFENFDLNKNYIIVNVDGITDKFNFLGSSKYLNGMRIVVLSYYDPFYGKDIASFKFNLSVDFICGDKICSNNEDSNICCTDCGCVSDKICENNICVKDVGNECELNVDCDDSDMCSSDFCNSTSVSRKCLHFRVFDCKSDDGCCPVGCSNEEDNDCVFFECKEDNDCDDNNECSENICLNNTCNFNEIESCGEESLQEVKKINFKEYIDFSKFSREFIIFLIGIVLLIFVILVYTSIIKSLERKKE